MSLLSSAALRRELSQRNLDRSSEEERELTYGAVPSVIYRDTDGCHPNFLGASYRAICGRPEWRKRLGKAYTSSRWVPRRHDRTRAELDCATSSDALLMNIFCYPRVLARPALQRLLGFDPLEERGAQPEFGFRPRIPLANGRGDSTEIDMRLGTLLVEAKLTENGFQSVPHRLVMRYRDLDAVFDPAALPQNEAAIHGYQLIRGALAAYAANRSFLLLCDGRRQDLVERWLEMLRAVHSAEFRSRLKLLTWQEVAATTPRPVQQFLAGKYGIAQG